MSSRFFIKTFSKILEETKILTKKHDFYILDRGKALILPFSRSKNRRFLLFFRRFLGAFRCNNQQTQKNEIRPCFEPKTSKKVTFRRFRHLNCVWWITHLKTLKNVKKERFFSENDCFWTGPSLSFFDLEADSMVPKSLFFEKAELFGVCL